MNGPTELPSLSDARFLGLLDAAKALQPRTTALRRSLHQCPELGLSLPRTQAAIQRELADLPLELQLGSSTTSITAVLRGAKPGPPVLLRADMDALPLTEETGLEFASTIDGVMHACGHDTHVAMLASAARLLAERQDQLAGSVVFMFQPGEEGHHGARHMIHEGVLEAAGQRVAHAFALHINSTAPAGLVYCRPGPILASADNFFIRVTGKGGHGSAPHYAVDPIPPAAEMVGTLQTMITRKVDTFEPAVLSVTRISAGTTNNIIPEAAELEGTIRTLSEEARTLIQDELVKVCDAVGQAHGCRVAVDITPGYPVTTNNPTEAERVLTLAHKTLGRKHSAPMTAPIMGAEDFSYVLQRVPGAFAFLGACPPDVSVTEAAPNHSNRVRFDESVFPHGVAMYAAYALDVLR